VTLYSVELMDQHNFLSDLRLQRYNLFTTPPNFLVIIFQIFYHRTTLYLSNRYKPTGAVSTHKTKVIRP